jgi:uncharacterized protein YoaH (UPF0181 family)
VSSPGGEDWEARFAEAARELLAAGLSEGELLTFLQTIAENWRDDEQGED